MEPSPCIASLSCFNHPIQTEIKKTAMANPKHLKILKQGVDVWNKWRRDHPGIIPNLKKADLAGAFLVMANLIGANLSEANLIGADLRMANLTAASLFAANLSKANLGGADLARAHLNGANLTKADLGGANLRGADLSGANFTGADLAFATFSYNKCKDIKISRDTIIGWTTFIDIDLSGFAGLSELDVRAPCYLDISTLVRSKGNIPKAFLEKIALPKLFIDYIPSIFSGDKAIMFYSSFISYTHKEPDKEFAEKLFNYLKANDVSCWLDKKKILPGQSLQETIIDAIRNSDKVLLCLSEQSLKSWWINNEIEAIIKREKELSRNQENPVSLLIPLDLDGYIFNVECQHRYKELLLSRDIALFAGWESDESIFERESIRLLEALKMPLNFS